MKLKTRPCDRCGNIRPVWKNIEGKKYCKACALVFTVKKTKIKSISQKQKKITTAYLQQRLLFLAHPKNRTCKAKLQGCTGLDPETMTIHHSRGRGVYMLDESTWIPLCGNCHRWVEDHPEEARKIGLTESRINKTNQTT
jgi:hypothetical protein